MSHSFALTADAWRSLRARYQRGLLAWLKGEESAIRQAGLAEMQAALLSIEASRSDSAFWRTVQTLLSALADGTLPADSRAHRLCGRFDRQLRLLAEGAAGVDRALISETFDFVTGAVLAAPAATATAAVAEVMTSPPVAPSSPAEEAPALAFAAAGVEEVALSSLPGLEDLRAAQVDEAPPLQDFSSLLLPSDDLDLDPAAVARWEAAAQTVWAAWHDRHQSGLAPFRSAVIALSGVGLDLHSADALRFAEALATVADRADEPEVLADARLVAAIAAALEVLVEPGSVNRKVFAGQVDNLSGRLAATLEEAAVPTEGRLIVSRTLYQMFVDEAHESLQHLRDELDTLHPLAGEMAEAASALADNAATIDLTAVRDLALALANALVRYEAPLNVDVAAERALVSTVLHILANMVDTVAAGEQPEAAPILIAALSSSGRSAG